MISEVEVPCSLRVARFVLIDAMAKSAGERIDV